MLKSLWCCCNTSRPGQEVSISQQQAQLIWAGSDDEQSSWNLKEWDEDAHMFKDENGGRVIQACERPPDEVPDREMQPEPAYFPLPMLCCSAVNSSADAYDSTSFVASLRKAPGNQLGLLLDDIDHRHCVVYQVKPGGLVDAWNQTARRDAVVSAGDLLLQVQGSSGGAQDLTARLREAWQATEPEGTMTLRFQRPRISYVSLVKQGRPLGITVAPVDERQPGTGIIIEEVSPDGALSDWNAAQRYKVEPGSRIVAVNGGRRHKSMLTTLQSNDYLNIKVIDWPDPSENA